MKNMKNLKQKLKMNSNEKEAKMLLFFCENLKILNKHENMSSYKNKTNYYKVDIYITIVI